MSQQAAAAEPGPPSSRRRAARQWLGDAGVSWLWAFNALLLGGLCLWIWNDIRFMEPAVYKWNLPGIKNIPPTQIPPPEMIPMTWGRWLAFRFLAVAAAASFAGIIVGLFLGAARHRSVRTWLAVLGLAAAWLGLATSWRDVAWAGRRWRAANLVEAFEPFASSLRENWPTHDGASDALGPYSAYPLGDVRMVMPLTARTAGGVPFTSIERSPAGGLRFELAGTERGAWLEWHPQGSSPASFRGGLDAGYELLRSSALQRGWYVAQYGEYAVSGPGETRVPFNRTEVTPSDESR